MENKYVVYWVERLRDGVEDGAKVVTSVATAEKVVNDLKSGFNGEAINCLVFRLGELVPVVTEVVLEPRSPLATKRYRVA